GQHVERGVTSFDDGVVELARVERSAEHLLRAAALADHFAVPDLVTAGLAGPRAIAVDLALDLGPLVAVALHEETNALLADLALVVEPRVDDEQAIPDRLILEVAEPPGRVLVVGAELVGELLGVERPAFGEGVEGEDGADQRELVR